MSDRPWHKRYHSDALTGYIILTLEERGAYTTLLDLMYDRGAPIHGNERLNAGYMGCSVRKYRSILNSLVDKGKVQMLADGRLNAAEYEMHPAVHFPSRPSLSRTARLEIIGRDGPFCRYCGKHADPIHIDHVIPRVRGGSDDASNLAVACRPCNLSKATKTPEEWLS